MNVAIVSIGDELMNGSTVDTNSSWIARKILKYKLLDVVSKVTVKDDINDIKDNEQVMGYPAIPLREFIKQRKKNEK